MRVFLLFALSGFAVLQSGQAQDMEPNLRCGSTSGEKQPGDTWIQEGNKANRLKWCECPFERPTGTILKPADYCFGICAWSYGPHIYEGDSYHIEGEVWEYERDNGYKYECVCSSHGNKVCDVKEGGHICEINDEIHHPGELGFLVEVGDVYSDRYEECDCPAVLPEGVSRWQRTTFCKGVCFDEDNLPHYEGESYVDRNHKCFRYNCVCHDHGGRECVMDLNGGHQCILGKERYNPGVTWRRRTMTRIGDDYGYQECTCPLIWENPRSTYFKTHQYCRGICYENATVTFYEENSPYIRSDETTGLELSCSCHNAGAENCHPA